jgi:cyclopropane-fatty-acyl-phospholipid synthase
MTRIRPDASTKTAESPIADPAASGGRAASAVSSSRGSGALRAGASLARPRPGGAERIVTRLFAAAGVAIDGDRPWDVRVHDERFFRSVLVQGTLGFGESYMRGWWEADEVEELAYRLLRARLHWMSWALPPNLFRFLNAALVNRQSRSGSALLADRHYNLGNDLFSAFLGAHKSYSCALFDGTNSLDTAQLLKMERLCQLLQLREGDHLLDVGGGWGAFAHHAASRYGCGVTSINIADEQIRYARQLCAGLPAEVVRCDYRDLTGTYDKVAVIAMLTHVGASNYRRFMSVVHHCLAEGGTMLIETLGSRLPKINCEPWADRYIFPGGVVPALRQIDRAAAGLFTRRYVAEFGDHYIPTLRAWNANLQAAWPVLGQRYPDTTRLMLEYFFLTVAGAFRAGYLRYWHILMDRRSTS